MRPEVKHIEGHLQRLTTWMQGMGQTYWLFITLAIFGVFFAVGEERVAGSSMSNLPVVYESPSLPNWEYEVPNSRATITKLQGSNFTCLGDFHITTDGRMELETWGDTQQTSVDVTGRCLYNNPVDLYAPPCRSSVSSFGTMFQVLVQHPSPNGRTSDTSPDVLQGLAFIITSDNATQGEGGGYLGWLNSTSNGQTSGHNFAVELDFFKNVEFDDPDGMHVGINVNSLTSKYTRQLQRRRSQSIPYTQIAVWIDYDALTEVLDVSVALHELDESSLGPSKPETPLISTDVNLTDLLKQSMFIGFSGSILRPSNVTSRSAYGSMFDIETWTFNVNGPAPDLKRNPDGSLRNTWAEKDKRIAARKKLLVIITVSTGIALVIALGFLTDASFAFYRRYSQLNALAKKYQLEELEQLGRGPKSFKYRVLSDATKGFHPSHLLGTGGFGSVYKGVVAGLSGARTPTQVAIKRISGTSHQGAREFLAEVKIIGQVQHRNLVRLLGWCHERGELLLVYDYMPNGSLDQHLFKKCEDDNTGSIECQGQHVLSWARRLKIVSGVAVALAYLHEEWEQRVIHRDVKSSNVMLDANFNARLGDFGLARSSDHAEAPPSTAVLAGTYGYLAPELANTLKATEKTDVYSFGVMVLEVATGRRPLLPLAERTRPEQVLLLDWVWGLYKEDNILEAADGTLKGAYDRGEMSTLLKMGLLCCHPNADGRPTMRQVMSIWKGASLFPPLPRNKPVPVFLLTDSFKFSIETTVGLDDKDRLLMPMEGYAEDFSDQMDYTEAHDSSSLPGRSVRSRPWKSSPLIM